MLSLPNYGVERINFFKGNLGPTHSNNTGGGDIVNQGVCNGVIFFFLVTSIWFCYHNFSILRVLFTTFESRCPKKLCVLSSCWLHDLYIRCGIGISDIISLVVKRACIGAGIIFGIFCVVLCDQYWSLSDLQDYCLNVGRVITNNVFLTSGDTVVISIHYFGLVSVWLGCCCAGRWRCGLASCSTLAT